MEHAGRLGITAVKLTVEKLNEAIAKQGSARILLSTLIMFLRALLSVMLHLHEKRPIVYADEEYDNAEASYAPYVLAMKRGRST